jgi:RNA polymerase sigma factor (sigma-70 family)
MEPNAAFGRPVDMSGEVQVRPHHDLGVDRTPDFAALYEQGYRGLVRLAYATTGSLATAEELVQDAFVQLLRHWSRVERPEPWIRRAVISNGTSWVRRQRRERAAIRPFSEAHHDQSSHEFLAMLAGLTPRQRCAVFLRYHDGCAEQDIAQLLDCRPGTVKSLLSRALTTLREERENER